MAFKFSFANKYNQERLFDIDSSGFEYHKLEDIFTDESEVFQVCGLYINTKGKFNEKSPVAATNEYYVNLPNHLLDVVEQILADKQAIKAINEGHVGFTIYPYEKNAFPDQHFYSVRWVDIP